MYVRRLAALAPALLAFVLAPVARAEDHAASHPGIAATHVTAQAAHVTGPATHLPAPSAHVPSPAAHVPAPATGHSAASTHAPTAPVRVSHHESAARARVAATLRLIPRDETAPSSGPPEHGYAQQGNTKTPWGEASTLPVHGEEKRLWRFANRQNPGYSTDGKDRFIGLAQPSDGPAARHDNCVLASLSFEDSMTGHETVALPGLGLNRTSPEALAAKTAELGDKLTQNYVPNAKESVVYATRFPNAVFDRADTYQPLEDRLKASGDGARMVFIARWQRPDGGQGGHAINMVNLHGTVVVVDAQSGRIATPETYFGGTNKWFGFRYHVTSEGAPGKSPFDDEAPVITLKSPAAQTAPAQTQTTPTQTPTVQTPTPTAP